jgi:hypothetical protein
VVSEGGGRAGDIQEPSARDQGGVVADPEAAASVGPKAAASGQGSGAPRWPGRQRPLVIGVVACALGSRPGWWKSQGGRGSSTGGGHNHGGVRQTSNCGV